MAYTFEPGLRYRMPTHFGPSTGPRQGPGGQRYDNSGYRALTVAMSCPAPREALERLLPERFELLAAEVGVSFAYYEDIPWLAGRGYNVFGVSVPTRFHGVEGPVEGDLLLVLWENMAEPIITGREELGVAKIFCDIPAAQEGTGELTCRASWDGCEFARLTFQDGPAAGEDPVPRPTFHYKYAPSTARPGEPDAAYVTMTPLPEDGVVSVVEARGGTARVDIAQVSWEQMPTQYMIVNALHDLGLGSGPARCISTLGAEDLSRQAALR